MNNSISIHDLDYSLPEELIAQRPIVPRSASKLMVINRKSGKISHHKFEEIGDFLRKDDLLIRNNTKVLPLRFFGRKKTGGRVEILLIHLEREKKNQWRALVKGKNLKINQTFLVEKKETIEVKILQKHGQGVCSLLFSHSIEEILPEIGYMPLPPYIQRDYSKKPNPKDQENYQTVYASKTGACAAPTAGLHFTTEVFKNLKAKGIHWEDITLHVGLGTFKPIRTEQIQDHKMHQEFYSISPQVQKRIETLNRAKNSLVAVGTTSVRTLESFKKTNRLSDWTDIFIYPPYQFQGVDILLTNFHLPKSTLLLLVYAFGGQELLQEAYNKAIQKKYRFFSYGDAMLIV